MPFNFGVQVFEEWGTRMGFEPLLMEGVKGVDGKGALESATSAAASGHP